MPSGPIVHLWRCYTDKQKSQELALESEHSRGIWKTRRGVRLTNEITIAQSSAPKPRLILSRAYILPHKKLNAIAHSIQPTIRMTGPRFTSPDGGGVERSTIVALVSDRGNAYSKTQGGQDRDSNVE